MAKKKGRGRGRQRRSREQAHSASSGHSKPDSTRVKATDLTYDPKKWEAHKYIILNHFESDMCSALLDGKLEPPQIHPQLAASLLLDHSRGGQQPPRPQLDPVYWTCNSEQQLARLGYELEGELAFQSLPSSSTAKPVKEEAKAEDAPQLTPFSGTNEHTAKAWAELSKWQKALAAFRAKNQIPDFIKHQKLLAYITSSLDNATGALEYPSHAIEFRFKIYTEVNMKVYSFFVNFIGRAYKYLKKGIERGDGLSLFHRCNIKQSKPSATSGQAVISRLINARQRRGQDYASYLQFITDICDEYAEATGGTEIDETLKRLALTAKDRIADFYHPVMDSISTNDLTTGKTTPLDGDISIAAAMLQYEIDNQSEFKLFQKKKKRDSHKEQAHEAASRGSPRRGQRNEQKRNNDNDNKDFPPCSWCTKFIPHIAGSHPDEKCRPRQQYVNMVCRICGQKGHPARLCREGKQGRAHQAQEEKSVNSNSSSRSRILSRRIDPPEDELNSAEAIKIIKQRHKYNKSRGRSRRYKIVEIDDEDSNSS